MSNPPELGTTVHGTVAEVHRFGVFVHLDGESADLPGTGFIRIPELAWEHFEDPTEVVRPGQRITATVLDVDTDRGQVQLSLKALREDPLVAFAARVGEVLSSTVVKVIPFGVFVRIAPGIMGLLHESVLARNPAVGEVVSVVIAEVDQPSRRVTLKPAPFLADVALRPIEDADLDALFEQMRDPESVRMAAFTSADPGDRAAFDAHMAKVRALPEVVNRAITFDGRLVGSIAGFVIEGDTEVTYWIDRAYWGRGIAGRALALLLADEVTVRPVFARVASDNHGSLRVLRKAGFAVIGTEISYANARGTEIEETILRLA
jgi:RimJ/RimL family protein N-acetyltransferase/predicted RNA-binding protein with RPS1 domain